MYNINRIVDSISLVLKQDNLLICMMKLNLGCGNDIRKGWINLDVSDTTGVDVIHDLNKLPLPFENEKFDVVLCKDVLEHVNFLPLINDIYRILKLKGYLIIRVPHFTSKSNYADPTHINQFSTNTFYYFTEEKKFGYNRSVKLFSKIKIKIDFEQFNIIFLRILNKVLEKWVNKSPRRQNFYERSFLRMFPALSIEILLKK